MTQTLPQPADQITEAGRLFIDASTVAAFNGRPPNKFTRLVEAVTRDIPGALVGTMTSDGFLLQDIVSFDTTLGFKSVFFAEQDAGALTRDPNAAFWPSFWQRTKLHVITALLRLALPGTVKSSLRNVGAYILATSYRSMPNAERRRLYGDLQIDDLARATKFAWWLNDDIEAARNRPFFRETQELIEVGAKDIVVFYGLAGGIGVPDILKGLAPKHRYKVACILLDISPLLSPGIIDRIHTRAAKEAVREFAKASDLLIVPSEIAAHELKRLLEDSRISCPNVSIVNTFLGLSPEGLQSKVLMPLSGTFALTVLTFKRRKNAYWLLSAWKAAARAIGNALPHLVIVSSASDDGSGWLLAEDEFLSARVTVVKGPTDPELRWLFTNAAFVIQPPAEGGLGITIVEALFFHKKVLCERHSASAYLQENALACRLDLDMDSWVNAIVETCTAPATAPQAICDNHARYACRYAEDLMACLANLRNVHSP